MERADGHRYLRPLRLAGHAGWVSVEPSLRGPWLQVTLAKSLAAAAAELEVRLRALCDLDTDLVAVAADLGHDRLLAPRLHCTPGLRVPGALGLFELGLRDILGQQVTAKAATTLFDRVVAAFGTPIQTPYPGLNRLAPEPAILADAPLERLIDTGLPARRARTVEHFARELAAGQLRLDPDQPAHQALQALQTLPGVGPWCARNIGMRALRHPDASPATDLRLIRSSALPTAQALRVRAATWQPWRAYAAMYLWHGQ